MSADPFGLSLTPPGGTVQDQCITRASENGCLPTDALIRREDRFRKPGIPGLVGGV